MWSFALLLVLQELGQGLLLIPLVHVSLVNVGSGFSIKIWILVFLGKYSNIFVGSQSVSIGVHIKNLFGLSKKKKKKKKKKVKLMWKEERGRWVNFYLSHFFHFHFPLDYKYTTKITHWPKKPHYSKSPIFSPPLFLLPKNHSTK